MSLSIEKLKHFTSSNGYEIHKLFTKNGRCFLVELMCIRTVDYMLLYIPSKYDFHLPSDISSYDLKEIPVDKSTGDDIGEYTHISESLIESSYSDVDSIMKLPINERTLPLSEHLDESYKSGVILDDIKGQDNIIIKDIYRQLRRLKYCIKGMPYKIAIKRSP